MKNLFRSLRWLFAAAAAAAVALAGHRGWQMAEIAAAYEAKTLCSGVFVSGLTPETVVAENLPHAERGLFSYVDTHVDYETPAVDASVFGWIKRIAVYRPGLGCTLLLGAPETRAQILDRSIPEEDMASSSYRPWPSWRDGVGATGQHREALERMDRIVDDAFNEPGPDRPRRTRAIVVAYRGKLLAERYAEGISSDTRLPGWSMSKMVVNALTGILVGRGQLSLHDAALLPQWRGAGDMRGAITVDHLLHMVSGLDFTENYASPLEDVVVMIFGSNDAAGYAADKPLRAVPGSQLYYSSGDTNIASRIIRDRIEGAGGNYLAFPHRNLFRRIGVKTAIVEPDPSGTYVGSSFMYATARDWARLGQLYLQDGVWNGERILPEGWVGYSTTSRTRPAGAYGAHFWLQIPPPYRSTANDWTALPADAYHAVGHEGQIVTIIPSLSLVVVRLGLTRVAGAWDHETFVSKIAAALPNAAANNDRRSSNF